jgi:hypothetical protein
MRIVESPTVIGSFGFALSATGSVYVPTPIACGAGAPQPGQKRAVSGIGFWQVGQVIRAAFAAAKAVPTWAPDGTGNSPDMEREAIDDEGRRDQDRSRVLNSGIEDAGTDDQEFSSVEDVGTPPSENPAVDDV